MYKKTPFGKIIITGSNFSENDKKIFKACASVIANITKDEEISKILKMQIHAFQEGFDKVKKSNEKITKLEKTKTDFISRISHELRTPLNSILGFSDLLEKEFVGKLNNKQKEYINDIKISALHLLGVINEVLDITKIEANAMKLNITHFSAQQPLNEVINVIKPLLIKKHQTLNTKIPEDIEIKADYQKLRQILFNLLSNAVKYTRENGKIIVKCIKKENKIYISIKDNGIGIEKKNLKKIFNKFEQLDRNQENSTGLGLAITKELVKLHRGAIKLVSIPEKGSTFTVILPIQ